MNIDEQHINELINLCKQGNKNARKTLYEIFSKKMMALCYRYLPNIQDAEDALCDGFISMYEHLHKYKQGNFTAWLSKIMINSCLIIIKKQKKFVLKEDNTMFDLAEDIEIDNPQRFNKNDIIKALESLPNAYRTIFNMAIIDEMKYDEICEHLNINKQTVKTVMYRAKKRLREFLINLEEERNNR